MLLVEGAVFFAEEGIDFLDVRGGGGAVGELAPFAHEGDGIGVGADVET
jgi:hypothetical protein